MKGQLSSHTYYKRSLAPGEATITGDNIAISLSASEDGEATEECSAVLTRCHYSHWRDVVTLPEQQCVPHHTFCWVGVVGAVLQVLSSLSKTYDTSMPSAIACLTGGLWWRAEKEAEKHIVWQTHFEGQALWRAGVWRFSVKSMRRAGWILFGFSSNVLFHSPRNALLRGCPFEGRCEEEGQDS